MSAPREWARRGDYTFTPGELDWLESDFDEVDYLAEVEARARAIARSRRHPCWLDDNPHPSQAEQSQHPESSEW